MALSLLSSFVDRVRAVQETTSAEEAKLLYEWFYRNSDIIKIDILSQLNNIMNQDEDTLDKEWKLVDKSPANIKNKLTICSKSAEFLLSDLPGARSINKLNVDIFLNTIKDPEAKIYAQSVIQHTRYIPDEEFMKCLYISLEMFRKNIGATPYAVVLSTKKYGSEWWILQRLFGSYFVGTEPNIITKSNPDTDPTNVVIIDDAIYSGIHLETALITFLYGTPRPREDAILRKRYTFHLIIPFISTVGYEYISNYLRNKADVFFYSCEGKTLPTFDIIEPKVFELTNKPGVRRMLDTNPDKTPLLIYFDHKIADGASTEEYIISSIVYPPPTRDPLERALKCYLK